MRSVRISALGKALADPSRAEVLCVLSTGNPRTAGQLAAYVGLAPSTTSRHLGVLVDAGLLSVEASGRHRYFRIRSPEVAELLGTIDVMDLPTPSPTASFRSTDITIARTCYDHLAGDVGVGLFEAMVSSDLIETDGAPRLTGRGHAALRELGIDTEALGSLRRPLVRGCLDWERQTQHLGGAIGGALFATMLNQRWLERRPDRRVVAITPFGERSLRDRFGLELRN